VDDPASLDFSDFILSPVFGFWEHGGKSPFARLIPRDWSIELQGLMGTVVVIAVPEMVEGFLTFAKGCEGSTLKNLRLKRSMESLDLSLGLGMVGASIEDVDA
jgi:hypothetical protein